MLLRGKEAGVCGRGDTTKRITARWERCWWPVKLSIIAYTQLQFAYLCSSMLWFVFVFVASQCCIHIFASKKRAREVVTRAFVHVFRIIFHRPRNALNWKKRTRVLHTKKHSLELCSNTTELNDYPFCDTSNTGRLTDTENLGFTFIWTHISGVCRDVGVFPFIGSHLQCASHLISSQPKSPHS